MNKDVVHRLKLIYKQECGSLNNLADEIGVPLDTLKNIFSRGTKPNLDVILKFAEHFPGYSMDWVLRGDGERYRTVIDGKSYASVGGDVPNSLNDIASLDSKDFMRIIANLTQSISKHDEIEKNRADIELLRAESDLKNADTLQRNSVNMRIMLELIAAKENLSVKEVMSEKGIEDGGINL